MPHSCEKILNNGDSLDSFLEEAINSCMSIGLISNSSVIDHVCYRVEEFEEYNLIKDELRKIGIIITESLIGGRPISIILLNEPIIYKSWQIPCIELPSPKLGSFYPSGWEHFEVVIGDSTMEPLRNKFFLEQFVRKYPEISFDLRSIEKEVNADVSISVGTKYSVKFHCCPIEEVVRFEKDHS